MKEQGTTAKEFEALMQPLGTLIESNEPPSVIAKELEKMIAQAKANDEPEPLVRAMEDFMVEVKFAESMDNQIDELLNGLIEGTA